jgi:hypothetical protein
LKHILIKSGDSIKDIPKSDFAEIIDSIDLYDISQYFISLDTDKWVPNCYWKTLDNISILKENRFFGEIMWGIYSYLIHKELLVIEDKYFGYNSNRTDMSKKYRTYFNPLENDLYILIIKRLLDENYLTENTNGYSMYYKIGNSYHRQKNLDELINH